MDTATRDLERQVATGEPGAALALYWHEERAGTERETASPEARLETAYGPVRLILHGSSVRVMAVEEENMVKDGDGARRVRHVVPVTVNRVDYNVSGAYFNSTRLGWSPFYPEKVEEVAARDGWLGGFEEPWRRWHNSFDLTRLNWTDYSKAKATDSAWGKFMAEVDTCLKAWIKANPEAMRQARRAEAARDLDNARKESDDAQAELDKAAALISDAMARYLSEGGDA